VASGAVRVPSETIATTALLFALDALTRDRVRACLLWMGLALLAREDVALVAAALGVWALAFRRPRAVTLGVLLIASGLAVLATTLFIVRPQFASASAQYGAMYHELARAPWQALPRLVWTPGSTPDTVLKLEMLAALLTPLAFLPIAAPATLLVALPAFAEHLLSERSQQHTIVYHYAALLIPVLAWGAMLGLARIARRRPRLGMALAVAMFAMTAVAQLAYGPFALPEWSHARAAERAWPSERDRLEAPVRDGWSSTCRQPGRSSRASNSCRGSPSAIPCIRSTTCWAGRTPTRAPPTPCRRTSMRCSRTSPIGGCVPTPPHPRPAAASPA
jgi:uncharacterized membrane protein